MVIDKDNSKFIQRDWRSVEQIKVIESFPVLLYHFFDSLQTVWVKKQDFLVLSQNILEAFFSISFRIEKPCNIGLVYNLETLEVFAFVC